MGTDFVITGGISKNVCIVKRLEESVGVKAIPIQKELDPIVAGAIDTGLFPSDLYEKEWKDV